MVITTESAGPGPLVVWSEAPTAPVSSAAVLPSEADAAPQETASSAAAQTPVRKRPAPASKKGSGGPAAGTVLAQLATLPVKGRAPKTGYERSNFGSGWKDPDRNGCDGRNDILRRDLTTVVARPGTQGCVITSGILNDPYTGTFIDFVRGQGTSNAVQIDHVVALSDAWQKGAQQLGDDQRIELANDPLNLLAVDGPTNASKGDGDAATWLPPRKSYRCAYVARQTAVKAKYGLWVTPAERDAIQRVVTAQCPGQKALR
ncbi:HNH endonuclease [Micrococcaceae bacterium RIT802]|nr:HNH endonuclease [Micrococcaceae bacterium RIT 802]